ncbi:MAG: endonuclease III domain-containing protein [Phycisphaerae bacterium]|nr:endonuclease III domain-containing protein [Phycisphaerae bacterium]
MTNKKNILQQFYDTMLTAFGHQHWWPGDSPFEVLVGAVLTQNTNWTNVEKAITNLKNANALDPFIIRDMPNEQLAALIKPSGYLNLKTKRLKNVIAFLCEKHEGDIENLKNYPVYQLREDLVSINGIGPETADSIILYALEKPTFVIDTYTHRILTRHQLIDPDAQYEDLKEYCQYNLPEDTQLYNECHALLVQIGKNYCKPKPKCENCPLNKYPHQLEELYT